MKLFRLVLPLLLVFSILLSSCNSADSTIKLEATSKPVQTTAVPADLTPAIDDQSDKTIKPPIQSAYWRKSKYNSRAYKIFDYEQADINGDSVLDDIYAIGKLDYNSESKKYDPLINIHSYILVLNNNKLLINKDLKKTEVEFGFGLYVEHGDIDGDKAEELLVQTDPHSNGHIYINSLLLKLNNGEFKSVNYNAIDSCTGLSAKWISKNKIQVFAKSLNVSAVCELSRNTLNYIKSDGYAGFEMYKDFPSFSRYEELRMEDVDQDGISEIASIINCGSYHTFMAEIYAHYKFTDGKWLLTKAQIAPYYPEKKPLDKSLALKTNDFEVDGITVGCVLSDVFKKFGKGYEKHYSVYYDYKSIRFKNGYVIDYNSKSITTIFYLPKGVSTARGIKLGDTLELVLATYGTQDDGNCTSWNSGGWLAYYLNENAAQRIEFHFTDMVVDEISMFKETE